MDFEQLHTFITVAQLKNFSRAAKALNVTQPTVTLRIKNLESEIGYALLERQPRSITLTKEGELFLGYSNMILRKITSAQNAIKLLQEPSIRIGIAPLLHPEFIANFIREIRLDGLTISLECQIESGQLINMLKDDKLDVAIISFPFHHEDLTLETIADDHLQLAVGMDHPLAHYPKVSTKMLNGETHIFYHKNTQLSAEITSVIDSVSKNTLFTNDQEVTKELVKAGCGFAIFPKHFLSDEDRKKMKIIPLEELQIKKGIYVGCNKQFLNNPFYNRLIHSIKISL